MRFIILNIQYFQVPRKSLAQNSVSSLVFLQTAGHIKEFKYTIIKHSKRTRNVNDMNLINSQWQPPNNSEAVSPSNSTINNLFIFVPRTFEKKRMRFMSRFQDSRHVLQIAVFLIYVKAIGIGANHLPHLYKWQTNYFTVDLLQIAFQ